MESDPHRPPAVFAFGRHDRLAEGEERLLPRLAPLRRTETGARPLTHSTPLSPRLGRAISRGSFFAAQARLPRSTVAGINSEPAGRGDPSQRPVCHERTYAFHRRPP